MSLWICPICDRAFQRARQSHVCVPGCTVEETFASRPDYQRGLYEAIEAHLAALGPVHADAVRVGVFLKRDRKFAEVRPMATSLTVWLLLPHAVDHARIVRRLPASEGRSWHVVKLTGDGAFDDQVRDWLTESYLACG